MLRHVRAACIQRRCHVSMTKVVPELAVARRGTRTAPCCSFAIHPELGDRDPQKFHLFPNCCRQYHQHHKPCHWKHHHFLAALIGPLLLILLLLIIIILIRPLHHLCSAGPFPRGRFCGGEQFPACPDPNAPKAKPQSDTFVQSHGRGYPPVIKHDWDIPSHYLNDLNLKIKTKVFNRFNGKIISK